MEKSYELIELQKKHLKLQDELLLQIKSNKTLLTKYGLLQDKHIRLLKDYISEIKPVKWWQFWRHEYVQPPITS